MADWHITSFASLAEEKVDKHLIRMWGKKWYYVPTVLERALSLWILGYWIHGCPSGQRMTSWPGWLPSAEIRTCGLRQKVILPTALGGHDWLMPSQSMHPIDIFVPTPTSVSDDIKMLLSLHRGIRAEKGQPEWWAVKRVIRSTGWGSSLLLPTTTSTRSSTNTTSITTTTTTAPTVQGESARSNSGQAKVLTVESGVFSALIPRIALFLILLPCPGESDSSMFSTYLGKCNDHETKAIVNCKCHIC